MFFAVNPQSTTGTAQNTNELMQNDPLITTEVTEQQKFDNRPYIVIHEPIPTRFEREVATAEDCGYVIVGHPCFHTFISIIEISGLREEQPTVFGTVLMRRTGKRNEWTTEV